MKLDSNKRYECSLKDALDCGIKTIYISGDEKDFVEIPTNVRALELLKKQHCGPQNNAHNISTPAKFGNVAILIFSKNRIIEVAIGWVGSQSEVKTEPI